MKFNFLFTLIIVYLICNSCSSNQQETIAVGVEIQENLHVPSPDWQDQIIYFILTDRFMDGDTSNNDQGTGEYQKGNTKYWNGGDLQGVLQRIDYIKELGATTVWVTPPVANQWINPQQTGTGNHGYWASNFMAVDKHLGTLDDYRQLSASLHKNDMYLIQDVVVNHLGDFHTYSGPYNPADVTENFKLHDVPQPTQDLFKFNDARKAEHLEKAIYHFAPNFYDHSDTLKKRAYQFADLDDLNTSSPEVRDELRKSFGYWIKEVGVDGFRFDTPHMVEHEFWNDFLHSKNLDFPGIIPLANSMGKKEFIGTGEVAIFPKHYDHQGTVDAAKYLGTTDKPEMNSILNFPLTLSIDRVFAEAKPTNTLTFRLNSIKKVFPRPEMLLNFIDNHDGERFLTKTDRVSFRQALLFVMTIPGVPVIYYGTEQELLGMRQTMFKGGAGSIDKDHFNKETASFQFVQDLIQLRKENDVLRRGELEVLLDDAAGAGLFIYKRTYNNSSAIVLINTSDEPRIADNIFTDFTPNTRVTSVFSVGNQKDFRIDANGFLSAEIAGKEAVVLFDNGKEYSSAELGSVTIDEIRKEVTNSGYIEVIGTFKSISEIYVAVDGDINRSITAVMNNGKWSCLLPLDSYINGAHRIVAFSQKDSELISDAVSIDLNNDEKFIVEVADPVGDDTGPLNSYQYPAHQSYQNQMDMTGAKVYQTGNNLRVDVFMKEITEIWLPPNGFDHVSLSIYFDFPNLKGTSDLPFKNAVVPRNGEWDLWFMSSGFQNASFTSQDASATHTGKDNGKMPLISVNKEEKLISFFFAASTLNFPATLEGVKIYVNTWHGGPDSPKNLVPERDDWSFGGGTSKDPYIMDELPIINL
ncbi:MAG: glycosidase [Cyclobacteriaceae bacterium]|jgi:glycosidase